MIRPPRVYNLKENSSTIKETILLIEDDADIRKGVRVLPGLMASGDDYLPKKDGNISSCRP